MFEMYFAGMIAIVALFLLCWGESQVSLSRTAPSGMQSVCPNATAVFTCRVTESSTLIWTSDEYIGSNNRLLFASSADMVGETKESINGDVAELTQNSGNVLESELSIHASVNSSIRCQPDNANSRETVNLTVYNGVPGMPTHVEAVELPFAGSCAILVNWDPPTDTSPEDISHYILSDSINGHRNETNTLATFLVDQCTDNLYINVSTVDRCGREGPTTANVMPNFLPQMNPVTDTTTPSGTLNTTADIPTATTTTTTANISSVSDILPVTISVVVTMVFVVIVFIALLSIMIGLLYRSKRKLEESEATKGYVQKTRIQHDLVVPWSRLAEITVKFLNEDKLTKWTIGNSQAMSKRAILGYANTWKEIGKGKIPSFVEATGGKPGLIRVNFNDEKICSSVLGKKAQSVPAKQPTMDLDLDCPSDEFKQYLIIQMFGHALGLSHEHRRSDFWKRIKPFVDTEKMRKDLGMTEEQFAINWPVADTEAMEEYDPDSIMHHWFNVKWLTQGYDDVENVNKHRGNGLDDEVAEALLRVHKYFYIPPTLPSAQDIKQMKKLYDDPVFTDKSIDSRDGGENNAAANTRQAHGGEEIPLNDMGDN